MTSQEFRRDTVRLPSVPWDTNRSVNCHTDRGVKLSSLRHFEDQFLSTVRERWGKKGPFFHRVCVFDVSRAVRIAQFESVSETHDTMPLSLRFRGRFGAFFAF